MADKAQQLAFLNDYSGYAKGVSYQTGIPANFILGQWALETGYGTKFAGTYNVGNIQGAAKRPYDYTTIQQGVQAYGNTLSNLRYSDARTASTPQEFGAALKKAGYAADPDYANKIANVINNVSSLTGEPNTAGGMFGGFSLDSFNPLEFIKSRGLDVIFLAVGAGLIVALIWNAGKTEVAKAVISEAV